MLYFIGIGLKGLSSISKEGYEIAQKCNKVYLEGYTSVLLDKEGLVKDLKAIELDREGIEQKGDEIDGDQADDGKDQKIKDLEATNAALEKENKALKDDPADPEGGKIHGQNSGEDVHPGY